MQPKYQRIFIPGFLLISFLYFYFILDPVLFYIKQKPFLILNFEHVKDYIVYPAGLLDFVSTYLLQFFIYHRAGVFILLIIIGLLLLLTRYVFSKTANLKADQLFLFIPAILVLLIYTAYDQSLVYVLGLLLTFSLFGIVPVKYYHSVWFNIVLFFLYPLIYMVAGSFSLFFALMILFNSLSQENIKIWRSFPLFMVIFNALMPFGFALLYYIVPLDKLYLYPVIGTRPFFNLLSLLILGFVVFRIFLGGFALKRSLSLLTQRIFVYAFLSMSIVVILIAYLKSGDKKEDKLLLKYDKFYLSKEWNKVLALYKNKPVDAVHIQYYLNKSLSENDKLLDLMFSYPQRYGEVGVVLKGAYSIHNLQLLSDCFFDMGLVNFAEHWAYESMEKEGMNIYNLRNAINCHIIKQQYSLVDKYVYVLKHAGMHNCPAFFDDCNPGNLLKTRSYMPDTAYFIQNADPVQYLACQLMSDPYNEKALQKLVAVCLLNGDLQKVIDALKFFRIQGYSELPQHIQEAILLYAFNQKTMLKNNTFNGFKINQEIINKFTRFFKIVRKHKGDRRAARNEMNVALGDTYWFYVSYSMKK